MGLKRYRPAMIGALAAALLGGGVAEARAWQPTAGAEAAVAADGCGLTEKLVPICEGQALYGGWVKGYPQEPTSGESWERQTREAVSRHGRQLDVVHMYHAPDGSRAMPFDDGAYGQAERRFTAEGRIVLANFKPGDSFAAGANGDYDGIFEEAAQNIMSVSPSKVMLALYHEPEDNLSAGSVCRDMVYNPEAPEGNTPENYRGMWNRARKVFDRVGATNVVWVMNYQGGSQTKPYKYDCAIEELWPGNDLVDWLAFDVYSRNGTTKSLTRFLDLLAAKTAAHGGPDDVNNPYRFTTKPYMLAEFGELNCGAADPGPNPPPNANRYAPKYYKALKALLNTKTAPIKAYVVFDTFAHDGDSRVSYNECTGALDPIEEKAYRDFATDPLLKPVVNNR